MVSADAVRRARARAQLLGGERGGLGVADVLRAVVGIQAQDELASALSIRARSGGPGVAEVEATLSEPSSVVLTWSLRGTRHFHHASDVRWIVGLLGPLFGRPGRRAQQLGIDGLAGDRAVMALRDALARDGPLTRAEVKERLAPHGVDRSGQAAIHLVRRAALEGSVCILPQPTGGERYALLDEREGPAATGDLDREQAAAELARRYLAAFGPATTEDFAAWSGLGAPVARRAWAAIASEVEKLDGSPRPSWVLAEAVDALPAVATRPVPLRLLGGFDTLWLGYADRSLLIAPEHAGRVNRGGGLVKPIVLADGEVVGTWAYRRRAHHVEVQPFRRLARAERAALGREVSDISRFLAVDLTVTVL